MTALIQACKISSNISTIDFNNDGSYFVVGGRDSIRIYSIQTSQKCWFESKKIINKTKGASITRVCASQLAWNKQASSNLIAIGTTSGYVLAYDVNDSYKNIILQKGHNGNVNNIQWVPKSNNLFISASFQNQILQWDTRTFKNVEKFTYSDHTQIRDVKFCPLQPQILAVQSFTKLQLSDCRKPNQVLACYDIHDNELKGIGVQWDPNDKYRLASAITKQISIFDVSSSKFEYRDGFTHYSLIKSFYWMKTKPTHFGLICQHPQKNIFVYDLQDKNKIAYMYGGHNKSIDCWKMNNSQTILLSSSNVKEKAAKNGQPQSSSAVIVGQYIHNYFDPHQPKFNYPLSFDNSATIALSINNQQYNKSSKQLKKSIIQTPPLVYKLQQKHELFKNIKQQIIFLASNYLLQGINQEVLNHNVKISIQAGKPHCAQLWKNLSQFAFPPEQQQITVQSMFQWKIKRDVSIIDNRVILQNIDQKMKNTVKIQVCSLLQWIIDQYSQIQTAAIALIWLQMRNPGYFSQKILMSIFAPYIQLLRRLQLFQIAAAIILSSKSKKLADITQNFTKFSIVCGTCKKTISKDPCDCTAICVICEQQLDNRIVTWCKYCGHGGHAIEYYKWFKIDKRKHCPSGCGHVCFLQDQL